MGRSCVLQIHTHALRGQRKASSFRALSIMFSDIVLFLIKPETHHFRGQASSQHLPISAPNTRITHSTCHLPGFYMDAWYLDSGLLVCTVSAPQLLTVVFEVLKIDIKVFLHARIFLICFVLFPIFIETYTWVNLGLHLNHADWGLLGQCAHICEAYTQKQHIK